MKLDQFNKNYKVTSIEKGPFEKFAEVGDVALQNISNIQLLLDQTAGATFDEGLFRIHNIGSFYYWTRLVFEYFKKYKGKSYVFGFDWMGRQFALTEKTNSSVILMLDPATAEVFELEASMEEFFNIDLVEGKEDLLEEKKFLTFKNKTIDSLRFNHCIGFVKPLFLGGKDEVANLEDSDMELYWELNYQIYRKSKKLPPGTLLEIVTI